MKKEPTKKDIRRVQELFLLSGWQTHPWFQKNFDEEFADYLNDFISGCIKDVVERRKKDVIEKLIAEEKRTNFPLKVSFILKTIKEL